MNEYIAEITPKTMNATIPVESAIPVPGKLLFALLFVLYTFIPLFVFVLVLTLELLFVFVLVLLFVFTLLFVLFGIIIVVPIIICASCLYQITSYK